MAWKGRSVSCPLAGGHTMPWSWSAIVITPGFEPSVTLTPCGATSISAGRLVDCACMLELPSVDLPPSHLRMLPPSCVYLLAAIRSLRVANQGTDSMEAIA